MPTTNVNAKGVKLLILMKEYFVACSMPTLVQECTELSLFLLGQARVSLGLLLLAPSLVLDFP